MKNEDQIVRIINLRQSTKEDCKMIEKIFNENLNDSIKLCCHCAAQIRFAQQRILNYYNNEKNQNNTLPPQPKKGCSKCKKKN